MHGEHCEQSQPEKYPHLNISRLEIINFSAPPLNDKNLSYARSRSIAPRDFKLQLTSIRKEKFPIIVSTHYTPSSPDDFSRTKVVTKKITAAISVTKKRNEERCLPRRSIYPAVIVFSGR